MTRCTISTSPPAPELTGWRALVTGLESTLPLRKHTPGSLATLVEYLHRRTAGMIGSLSHLVRGAAIDAILDGTERVTRAHLDAVRLDHAAESYNTTRPTKTPRRPSAATVA